MKKIIMFFMACTMIACPNVTESKSQVDQESNPQSDIVVASKAPATVYAIDMGLSVKWASCNLGADAVTKPGDYFAWGETNTKSYFEWDNYKWMEPGKNVWWYLTKYQRYVGDNRCTWEKGGEYRGDDLFQIELDDDAASMTWEGGWRIPTQEEWKELLSNCDIQAKWDGDVYGYQLTSKINGYENAQIFLPALDVKVGIKENNSRWSWKGDCFYWSSTLHEAYCDAGAAIMLSNGSGYSTEYIERCYGLHIRPVRK